MSEPIFDETVSKQQVERVRRTVTIANATEPRAVLARYDALNESVVIQLKSGATFTFPSSTTRNLNYNQETPQAQNREG